MVCCLSGGAFFVFGGATLRPERGGRKGNAARVQAMRQVYERKPLKQIDILVIKS
jgi:hypothetical protein